LCIDALKEILRKLGKMAKISVQAVDIFRDGFCGVCGVEEMSQYYNINSNYIGYGEIYLPLREILNESLGLEVSFSMI
jgi:hypothetical protein